MSTEAENNASATQWLADMTMLHGVMARAIKSNKTTARDLSQLTATCVAHTMVGVSIMIAKGTPSIQPTVPAEDPRQLKLFPTV